MGTEVTAWRRCSPSKESWRLGRAFERNNSPAKRRHKRKRWTPRRVVSPRQKRSRCADLHQQRLALDGLRLLELFGRSSPLIRQVGQQLIPSSDLDLAGEHHVEAVAQLAFSQQGRPARHLSSPEQFDQSFALQL